MSKFALVLLALVAALTFACGDDDADSSATTVATATAIESPSGDPTPVQLASVRFSPAVTLTASIEWNKPLDTETELIFEVPRQASAPDGTVGFFFPETVYKPDDTTKTEAAPADWIEWFTTHPLLIVRGQEDASLGGLSGQRIELVGNSVDGIKLFVVSDGPFELRFNEHFYAYVLDSNGRQMVVLVISENPAQFAPFVESVQPALDSLEFAP